MIAKELWADILKRVPVKSLCRFRCVCRSWNSLLSSSFFQTHHLKFTTTQPKTTTTATHFQLSYTFHGIYGNESSCALYNQQDDTTTPLHPPLKPPHHLTLCLGVIHGVVCFYYCLSPASESIALWNPAIRKSVPVAWPIDDPLQHHTFIGFGFDVCKTDFKVVRGQLDYYEVFSVREGVWRRKAFHDLFLPNFHGSSCFYDGSIYWLGSREISGLASYGLMLCDCGSEEFRTVDLPEQVRWYHGRVPKVFVWGGLLTFMRFTSADIDQDCGICELWTMQEDGDTRKWSKLRRIDATAGDIIMNRFRLIPFDHEKGWFELIDNIEKDSYVLEESMLLTDIGKPYDEDQEDVAA